MIPAPPDRAWEALATSEGFSRLYEGMKVVITQINVPSAESREHSAANWKELLEKAASSLTAES